MQLRQVGAGVLALVVLCSLGADWRQFRGPDLTGVANAPLPTSWTAEENRAWQANLPGKGVSSPILVDGHVLITASSGPKEERLHVLSFAASDGHLEWERQYWATGRTLCHPTSAVAAPTPASDGQRVFAFYSSNDLACLDLAGNLLWFRGLTHDFPTAANDVGMASSPVVTADVVVVQVECQGKSFAAGIDKQSGETRWEVPRQKSANWASPAVVRDTQGREVVLLQSGDRLTAHDPATGAERWVHPESCSTIPSVVAAGDLLLVPGGGLTALRVGASAPEVVWKELRLDPSSASPVVRAEHVYSLSRAGVLNCAEWATGKLVWQLRLKGPFWATPLIAGDYLYALNQDGLAQVVRLGATGEEAFTFEFGEPVLGSPAAADGALYVRGEKHLWKIASR